ncbi:lipase family protein [Streptomyces lydicus]
MRTPAGRASPAPRRTRVWFTGHSLGGALATPAGARLHFEEPHVTAEGVLHHTMPLLTGLVDRVKGFTADLLAPASDGVRDHFMHAYVHALEKNQN